MRNAPGGMAPSAKGYKAAIHATNDTLMHDCRRAGVNHRWLLHSSMQTPNTGQSKPRQLVCNNQRWRGLRHHQYDGVTLEMYVDCQRLSIARAAGVQPLITISDSH